MAPYNVSAQDGFDSSVFRNSRLSSPLFESEASDIMAYLASLGPSGIARDMRVTMSLALKSYELSLDFALKEKGYAAMEAFTGDVFQALDFKNLPENSVSFSANRLFIVSSLYGLLRVNDSIRPYRLDYNVACAPGGENLPVYWKSKVTKALVGFMKDSGESEILNLLPGDAAKYIDWKIIRKSAEVIKPDFKVVTENGELKSPDHRRLKSLRGKMVSAILMDKIDSLDGIRTLVTPWFGADPDLSQPSTPLFIAI